MPLYGNTTCICLKRDNVSAAINHISAQLHKSSAIRRARGWNNATRNHQLQARVKVIDIFEKLFSKSCVQFQHSPSRVVTATLTSSHKPSCVYCTHCRNPSPTESLRAQSKSHNPFFFRSASPQMEFRPNHSALSIHPTLLIQSVSTWFQIFTTCKATSVAKPPFSYPQSALYIDLATSHADCIPATALDFHPNISPAYSPRITSSCLTDPHSDIWHLHIVVVGIAAGHRKCERRL